MGKWLFWIFWPVNEQSIAYRSHPASHLILCSLWANTAFYIFKWLKKSKAEVYFVNMKVTCNVNIRVHAVCGWVPVAGQSRVVEAETTYGIPIASHCCLAHYRPQCHGCNSAVFWMPHTSLDYSIYFLFIISACMSCQEEKRKWLLVVTL